MAFFFNLSNLCFRDLILNSRMLLLQDLETFTMLLDFLRYSMILRVRFMEPVHGRSECSVNLDLNVGQNAKQSV